jgi:uncharacterized protein (TIGR02594 family)
MNEVAWLERARALKGLHEIPGPQSEPEILALAADAGCPWVHDDETAWCALFVGGTLKRAGVKPSGSAAARSYQHWGIDVLEDGALFAPVGSIIVLSRGDDPSHGHVAYAVGRTNDGRILLLGGNQKDMVRIDAFPVWRVIAARWPEEARTDLRLLQRLPELDWDGASSTTEA